jgi:hypothetical protein
VRGDVYSAEGDLSDLPHERFDAAFVPVDDGHEARALEDQVARVEVAMHGRSCQRSS